MEPTQDLNVFFEGAKTSLAEIGQLNSEATRLKNEQSQLQRSLDEQQKELDDALNSRFNKALSEIEKPYNAEIDKEEDQLARAQKKREKAKSQGIKERITEETSPLRTEIREIESEIHAIFKKDKIPGYCNTGLYYSLFLPKSIGDYLLILLLFAIAFFLLPVGIWKLFFDGNTIALIIIYVLDILIFGGIIVSISRSTVMKYHNTLEDVREKRNAIAYNRRKINSITRDIENDTNESYYDLAVFDDEIAHIRQQLADTTMKKNDAINKFETVTKNIITEEMTAQAKPEMDKIRAELDRIAARLNELEPVRKAKAQEINLKYEAYLGKDYMTRKKIEALEDIINHGTATTLQEAKEELDRREDI